MRIVGTAGHVDHGKSALVLSLTGCDPDRLEEEHRRGMTLDLGFAPLRFSDGAVAGVIDVPGHERFLHNMLAGAAGIDVLLLVVDAVEGPRRQTIEHLQILDLLRVRSVIVVLTKRDLVDDVRIAEAASLVRDVTRGTVADGAPIVAVSNVTGEGIEALRDAIHFAVRGLPGPPSDAPVYLPIDRAFTLAGQGTIVTGTLMQGSIRTGDELIVQPAGRMVRIQSMEIFGEPVALATAGARVAANLTGVERTAVSRGDVLASPVLEPVTALDVEFQPLRESLGLLRRRTPVHVHLAAAEIAGTLVFDLRPPTEPVPTHARLELSRPAIGIAGARAIVRRASPKELLGGAVIRGRSAGDAIDTTPRAEPSAENSIRRVLEASALVPVGVLALARDANVIAEAAESAIAALVERGEAVLLRKPVEYLSRRNADAAWSAVEAVLRARHDAAPWRVGCTAEEVALASSLDTVLAVRMLAAWRESGVVAARAGCWHLHGFVPRLTEEQRTFFSRVIAPARTTLIPLARGPLENAVAESAIADIAEAYASLLATGALVRIGDDIYPRAQLGRATDAVSRTLDASPSGCTLSQLREALGLSRRQALPLMEYLDQVGFTVRDGDVRRRRHAG